VQYIVNNFKVPDNPYADSRVISTRITPDFHKSLRELAAKQDCAVAALMKAALHAYVVANAN
jgi:predicted transcriptional regulator